MDKKNNRRKLGKIPTPFSNKQVIRLFDKIDNPKIALVCFLSLRTGLRIGDIIKLKLSNINWELNRLSLITEKTHKNMTIILDKRVMKILRTWVSLLWNTDYIFPSPTKKNEHISVEGFYNVYKRYLIRSGLWIIDKNRTEKGNKNYHLYNFHTFRSTFASLLVNKGVPIYVAKELLGHSDVRTTEKHYIAMGSPALTFEINKVFGKNKNQVLQQEATDSIINADNHIQNFNNSFDNVQSNNLTMDPLHILQLKLANGEISIDDFQKKSNMILNLRKNADIVHNEKKDYIG
jgi:integrase